MTPFKDSTLKGKTILWMGTSIPEGHDQSVEDVSKRKTYPDIVAELCGAKVINQALGASAARANVRTGDWVRISPYTGRSLSQTLEEKEFLIAHWKEINPLTKNPAVYPDGLEAVMDKNVRPASFERKLLPWLDGREPMPDLFVFDHGHNDQYRPTDKDWFDIGMEPNAQNIRAGLLAPDAYMVKNDYENLRRFFGDLSGIPQARFESFVASVNRNCFLGAANFLFTLILRYNPYARIVVLGNCSFDKPHVIAAQKKLAESWGFAFIEPGRELGWGTHLIPGTAKFWDPEGTEDLTQKHIYCRDNTHPHTDTHGKTISLYGRVLAEKLRYFPL